MQDHASLMGTEFEKKKEFLISKYIIDFELWILSSHKIAPDEPAQMEMFSF